MKLIHYYQPETGGAWGLMEFDEVFPLVTDAAAGNAFLSSLLQWPEPVSALVQIYATLQRGPSLPFSELAAGAPSLTSRHLLPPLDLQEVWAAGVTYQRSKIARMEESEGAAHFYDAVYDAPRPELFFKGTASRVSGSGGPLRIREDATWNVPEPEVALVISPTGKLIGYTVGNDMSSRDIEGENPLYLPQAKVYRQSCGLGPAIWFETTNHDRLPLEITMRIRRGGAEVFSGSTNTQQMKRSFEDLIEWLQRDNLFPHGVLLLTGTGLVPGDDFTLKPGDEVSIAVPEIGTLTNHIVQGPYDKS